ncbi:acyl carrier protein [Flavobacterium sp. 102]|uniref:acyl carrier protein n=1 Tax=Flavobacterium sp. 102 TaxID=2135623 RepID=UPI000EB26FF8|nr:acyl carrier protein [Flavobacterium sp. 102]RKS01875.1 acyl carrier protein [Flavobacterium sp. 102]
MEKELFEQLEDILELDPGTVTLTDTFRDYDNWDSMANLSVIAMLDDSFGVHIASQDFKNLITVGDLAEEVKKRMA